MSGSSCAHWAAAADFAPIDVLATKYRLVHSELIGRIHSLERFPKLFVVELVSLLDVAVAEQLLCFCFRNAAVARIPFKNLLRDISQIRRACNFEIASARLWRVLDNPALLLELFRRFHLDI